MRAPAAALLPLLLLAIALPAAAKPVVTIEPLDAPVRPLQDVATTTMQVTLPCEGLPNGTHTLALSVTRAPRWANVTITPSAFSVDVEGCGAGYDATLAVRADQTAPAHTASPVEVTATLALPEGPANGSAVLAVVPAFFGILDVQAQETIRVARPQSVAVFPIVIANLGNGMTRITFEILSKPEALIAVVPQPVVLQSPHSGGIIVNATVPFAVQTPYSNGYTDRQAAVTLRITSASATHPQEKGDDATVSFVVGTRGWYVPGPATPLVVLAGVAAVALLGRRARR